ncbi:hypothetical protein ACFFUT_17120 [Pseudohalocynthiibacter aestuariivivens]|uniref:MerR family transcriptional regulator n=1 Tax=Pseudohalocynthiibacter aestuariivivens TaxID=1591409 RepID=A0ABV5JJ86_9RHOB|nr:hypothetical protein [Pseudohalocynthiibacter aestuariivivens]MBS9716746.1 hypothetical protein [Pseudohalocynthiibacter aestuariivivens]
MTDIYSLPTPAIHALIPSTMRALRGWLRGLPSERRGHTKFYRLSNTVVRLRQARKKGLSTVEIESLVAADVAARIHSEPGVDLGDDATARAAELLTTFTQPELERLQRVQIAFVTGLVTAFWSTPVHSIVTHVLHLHPDVLRYILTGQSDAIPMLESEWRAFSLQFYTANLHNAYQTQSKVA